MKRMMKMMTMMKMDRKLNSIGSTTQYIQNTKTKSTTNLKKNHRVLSVMQFYIFSVFNRPGVAGAVL